MKVVSALLLPALFFSSSIPSIAAQTYKVINNCPTAIDLFIGQSSKGSLAKGASNTYTGLGTSAGFFYASNRGGVVEGKTYAVRAGFFFEVSLTTSTSNLARQMSDTQMVAEILVLLYCTRSQLERIQYGH